MKLTPIATYRSMMPQPQQLTKSIKSASEALASGNTNVVDAEKFESALSTYINNVDDKQKTSALAIQDLVTGKTNDILPVVNEVAKADLSFKLLMGVRNKVIEAYKETMNMQI